MKVGRSTRKSLQDRLKYPDIAGKAQGPGHPAASMHKKDQGGLP
jgi:hypothetical protein